MYLKHIHTTGGSTVLRIHLSFSSDLVGPQASLFLEFRDLPMISKPGWISRLRACLLAVILPVTSDVTLADLVGACPAHAPTKGSRFFRSDIQNFENVTASGVHTPLRGPRPPTGNPGSATVLHLIFHQSGFLLKLRLSWTICLFFSAKLKKLWLPNGQY